MEKTPEPRPRRDGPVVRGPVGDRFSKNLRSLRERRGWNQARLAEELAKIDHPVGVNSVSRLEKGERRADVSDLVALAVVLNCSPAMLFLPMTEPADGTAPLAQGFSERWAWAWAWACGQSPIRDPAPDPQLDSSEVSAAYKRWAIENAPHWPHRGFTGDHVVAFDRDSGVQALVEAMFAAVDSGHDVNHLHEYLAHAVHMRSRWAAGNSAIVPEESGGC